MSKTWIVIPARGGSVGIPRKNLWLLNERPMVWHAITAAKEASANTVLITDDDEISEVGETLGIEVIMEPATATGKKTLDEVVFSFLPKLRELGAKDEDQLITLQPTSPLISVETLRQAIELLADKGSVISVSDDRHLRWKKDSNGYQPEYEKRVNRQLLPESWRETGAVIGCLIADFEANQTRIGQPVKLIQLPEQEAIDIDSFSDLAIAEHFFSRKTIFFKTDSSQQLGMGHVYRVLSLAQELARHELKIFLSPEMPLGEEFFSQYGFHHQSITNEQFIQQVIQNKPDLVVFDILDTEAKMIQEIRNGSPETKIVSFEDQGSGAREVDLLISDVYPNPEVPSEKQLVGIEHAVLAPSFETLERVRENSDRVEEIAVLFGGTDPSGLAEKALDALEEIGFAGKVSLIRGLGATPIEREFNLDIDYLSNVKNMPRVLAKADLALSSAGRTITELASLGVPTICFAQNEKELTHSHTTEQNGVIMLGLGKDLSVSNLATEISKLIDNRGLRNTLSENAKRSTGNRSNKKIVAEILGRLFS